MQTLAISKGGECLSEQYVNIKTKLLWKCSERHEWKATGGDVVAGRWCKKCRLKSKITINEPRRLAMERGGECLSNEYTNSNEKLTWKCGKGHIWNATYKDVKYAQSWCPDCGGRKKFTLEFMKELAEKNGGEFLSTHYERTHDRYEWKCKHGHTWKAVANSVVHGAWCPHCAKVARKTLEQCKSFAIDKGGDCLSDTYVNSASKLRWKCSEGHEWDAIANNVFRGTWCPQCSLENRECGVGETRGLKTLAETGHEFKKIRPEWMKSESGFSLELDGYCEERKIAFEYNGIAHYKYIPYFHKAKSLFLTTRRRDSLKRKVCAEQGIILIQLHEVLNPTEKRIRAALVEYCIRNAVPLELNPEYAEMLTLPNYGLDSEA